MQHSTEIPDIYYICNERFGVKWNDGIIFTYGDTAYSKFPLEPSLVIHEGTHVEQQRAFGGPIVWWHQYLKDPAFRLSQELEAYINQMRFIRRTEKDRNKRAWAHNKLAKDLSGSMYGGLMTFQEAFKKLS